MKRVLSVFVCFAMVATMLSCLGVTAFAADAHIHCLCVGLDGEEAAHNEAQVWTAWTSTTSLPSSAGYYYLENDVVLSAKWMPAKGTKLCLNGHAIIGNVKDSQSNNNSAIIDDRWTDLELSDCNGSDSVHYFTVSSSGLYVLDTDGDYDGDEVVSGGIITGAKNNIAFWDSSGNYSYTVPGTSIKVGRYMTNASAGPNVGAGGAIHLREANLNMYGGTIVGNSAGQGGAFSGKSGNATFKGV